MLQMETGLPTKEVFNIIVKHALGFKDSIKATTHDTTSCSDTLRELVAATFCLV